MRRTAPRVRSLPARCPPGPQSVCAATRGPSRYVRSSMFPAFSAAVSASCLKAALLCRTACSMLLRVLAPCSRPKLVSRMLRQSCGCSAACNVAAGTCAQKTGCLQTHMQDDGFIARPCDRPKKSCTGNTQFRSQLAKRQIIMAWRGPGTAASAQRCRRACRPRVPSTPSCAGALALVACHASPEAEARQWSRCLLLHALGVFLSTCFVPVMLLAGMLQYEVS